MDADRLLEFAGGDQQNLAELIDLYISQTTRQLAQIQLALENGNGSELATIAHSCAGASATCGMIAIVPILRQLEYLGKVGDMIDLPKLCRAAQMEFQRIQVSLRGDPTLNISPTCPSIL